MLRIIIFNLIILYLCSELMIFSHYCFVFFCIIILMLSCYKNTNRNYKFIYSSSITIVLFQVYFV